MKDEIKMLLSVQERDLELDRLSGELAAIPTKISAIKASIDAAKKALEDAKKEALHQYAKELLDAKDVNKAWQVLLSQ